MSETTLHTTLLSCTPNYLLTHIDSNRTFTLDVLTFREMRRPVLWMMYTA